MRDQRFDKVAGIIAGAIILCLFTIIPVLVVKSATKLAAAILGAAFSSVGTLIGLLVCWLLFQLFLFVMNPKRGKNNG